MNTKSTRWTIDKEKATDEICQIFKEIKSLTQTDKDHLDTLRQGKLFELYVLAKLVEDLKSRGCQIKFTDTSIRFKQAPGKLKIADPHFLVKPETAEELPIEETPYRLFVNIEILTLGYDLRRKRNANEDSDRSAIHELDLVLVYHLADGNPTHKQIVLAVECKSNSKLEKNFVREALGLRRELSILPLERRRSRLADLCDPRIERALPAKPASEFWLAYIDPDGNEYAQSPEEFGIDLKLYELKLAEPDAPDQ